MDKLFEYGDFKNTIEAMKKLLTCSHSCPIAPDVIPLAPFQNIDPFTIMTAPGTVRESTVRSFLIDKTEIASKPQQPDTKTPMKTVKTPKTVKKPLKTVIQPFKTVLTHQKPLKPLKNR